MIDFLIKFSPVVTAACFMASILVALWQIRINRLIQQRSKAQDLWSMYLSKGIEFPLLAYPLRHVKFNFPTKSLSTGRKDEDEQQEFERYEWLLSFLLKTAREILQEFSEDEFWIKTIK